MSLGISTFLHEWRDDCIHATFILYFIKSNWKLILFVDLNI